MTLHVSCKVTQSLLLLFCPLRMGSLHGLDELNQEGGALLQVLLAEGISFKSMISLIDLHRVRKNIYALNNNVVCTALIPTHTDLHETIAVGVIHSITPAIYFGSSTRLSGDDASNEGRVDFETVEGTVSIRTHHYKHISNNFQAKTTT